MNLLILNDNDQINDNQYLIADHRSEHIRNILKLTVGSQINLGLINNSLGVGVIDKIENDKILINIQGLKEIKRNKQNIDIICALPRPQTIKKVLFIAGMTGIRNVFFIRANRVEKSFFQSVMLEESEYMKHLLEGMSQGKQIFLPKVSFHNKFKPFFEDYLPENSREEKNIIKLLPDIDATSYLDKNHIKNQSNLLLAIGPEGGWVPFELDLMESIEFRKFKLSDYTLRVEHALMASVSHLELLNSQ